MTEKESDSELMKNELCNALHNMLGAFDTLVRRVKYKTEFGEEAIKTAHEALNKAGRAFILN